MTRRTWLAGVTGTLTVTASARAVNGLQPLDEAAFERMVAEHRGKVLLVDFWATWCAPCREELPQLVTLHSQEAQKGLDFVTVSCDDPEQALQAAAFVAAKNAPSPRYIRQAKDDDKFINAIDPKWSGALPGLFIYNRHGALIRSFIGETDMKQLQATVSKALSA